MVKGKIILCGAGCWKEKDDSEKRKKLGLERTRTVSGPQELWRILCTDMLNIQSIPSLECLLYCRGWKAENYISQVSLQLESDGI